MDREEGLPKTCKPIDTEKEKINWHVIQVQYVAFADAKA